MPEIGQETNRFRVGYALPQRKLESFMLPPFLNYAAQKGIDFIPIDPSTPLAHQGPFHCIIHKLYGHQWNLDLHHFILRHPTAVVIDPPAAIHRLNNRISMLQPIPLLNIPRLNIPNQILLQDSMADLSSENQLSFPVIAKPLLVDGTTTSHNMSLVFNRDGLANGLELQPPMVLQQFVNHGGIMFKVYVAGDYVTCEKRNSLPDISPERMEKMALESGGVMGFSQISSFAMAGDFNSGENVTAPAPEFVEEVAKGLKGALGLHLFNFDMIRDGNGDGFLVVDINYFPGFEKLASYETVMTDFLLNVMKSRAAVEEHGGDEKPPVKLVS